MKATALALAILAAGVCRAAPTAPWDDPAVTARPVSWPAPETLGAEGVNACFIDGVPLNGRPTRFFAYWGLPAGAKPGDRVPGIVLVHGGGATALAHWVRLWTARGYAAISMDTCGGVPRVNGKKPENPAWGPDWDRHEWSGPVGWGNCLTNALAAVRDQWPYHAVAAVIRSRLFLAARPEVDPEAIGVTGVSWGGYLTCIAASVDHSFRFAVPVYGCGFLASHSEWQGELARLGDAGRRWCGLWDPSVYLPKATAPFLWVDGTGDFHYPLDSLARSAALVKGSRFVTIKDMIHSHGAPGENPPEILAFADHALGRDGGKGWVSFSGIRVGKGAVDLAVDLGGRPVDRVELVWTCDANPEWHRRVWEARTVEDADPKGGKLHIPLPDDVRALTVNLVRDGEMTYSSGPVFVAEPVLR